MGLWTYAQDFLQAATVLVRPNQISTPAYYLVCHSIELALKAFLRGNSVSLAKLKKIGHDLEEALRQCNSLGLSSYCSLSKKQILSIQLMNQYYEAKELEYIVTGFKQYPEIGLLITASQTLLQGVRPFCFERRTAAEEQKT